MHDFVHLHVHSQYSLLDGQASIARLVDKAIADGQQGLALTDHGNMFGVKEFWNYIKKKNGARRDALKKTKAQIEELQAVVDGGEATSEQEAELAKLKAEYDALPKEDFKAIIGCEVYVARRGMAMREGKIDQSGYHLILLAKNKTGYHNLIKLVSRAWTDGYYMRPRTERSELEKYHEGLICCSACLGGEIPKLITQGDLAAAEESVKWYRDLFGDDYYLELQLHKATVERANHEAYQLQLVVNEHLKEFSQRLGVKLVCTNDVHFVDEDNAEAHDRLICLSTGKDLDDPKRMLYSKQEWMK
ncbi:MAG: PHP domain-containing protein, partial [Alistipes sp.]|nr:PHP domain-containing protein [Alistipes sp.]